MREGFRTGQLKVEGILKQRGNRKNNKKVGMKSKEEGQAEDK